MEWYVCLELSVALVGVAMVMSLVQNRVLKDNNGLRMTGVAMLAILALIGIAAGLVVWASARGVSLL